MIQVPAQHQTNPDKAPGWFIVPDTVKPIGAKWEPGVVHITTLAGGIKEYEEEQKKDKKLSDYSYLELLRFFGSENAR